MTPLPLRLKANKSITHILDKNRVCKGFSITRLTRIFNVSIARERKSLKFIYGFSFINRVCKGFSFIEMLIAISVMAIIFSFGFANYRDFSKRKQVEAAVSQVEGDLAFTKEYALSGVKPSNVNCNSPQVLMLYRFEISSATTYTISARCSGGGAGGTLVNAKTTAPLPYGVTMSSEVLTNCTTASGSGSFVEFLPRGNGTSLRSADCFRIRFTQSGFTQDIVIDSSGSVR